MRMKSRKGLSILLVFVLVFSLTVTAYAAWPSFQKDADNNGVIDTPTPTTNPETVLRVGLPTNDPYNAAWSSNSVWTGVDTTSVISGGKAYTVYNGGVTEGAIGGARLGITDLTSGDTKSIQIAAGASNGFLLSTPVIAGNDLYTAITGIVDFDTSPAFNTTNWTNPPTGMFYTDGILGIDSSTTGTVTTNTYDIHFAEATSTFTIQTDISTGNGTPIDYSISLFDGSATYNIVPTTTAPGTGTSLVTYNGAAIPAGDYKIILTVETDYLGKVYGITFRGNGWGLYKVANFASTAPVVSLVKDSNNTDIAYQGQANTPIYYDGDYLYWGIYGGTKSYYQFDISSSDLAAFAANDDFYWAGAVVTNDGGENGVVVFGGDSGKLYVRDVTAFDSIGYDVPIDPDNYIRSTVASKDGYLYFTDRSADGDPAAGNIYKVEAATLSTTPNIVSLAFPAESISTSTPVISENDYIYVGYTIPRQYPTPSEGGVVVVEAGSFSSSIDIYIGDPVQASPIVYSISTGPLANRVDYIYFTTNSSDGKGYAYSYTPFSSTVASLWQAGGASGNHYAVQGFASDNGYLVYGDDGGMLYIIK